MASATATATSPATCRRRHAAAAQGEVSTPEISPLVLPCSVLCAGAGHHADTDIEELVLPCAALRLDGGGRYSQAESGYEGDRSRAATSESSGLSSWDGDNGEGGVPGSVLGGLVYTSPVEVSASEDDDDDVSLEGNKNVNSRTPNPPTTQLSLPPAPLPALPQLTTLTSFPPISPPPSSETTALLASTTIPVPHGYGATPRPPNRRNSKPVKPPGKMYKTKKARRMFRRHGSPIFGARPASRMRYGPRPGSAHGAYESFPEYQEGFRWRGICRWFCC
ncbi:hypothetical protein QBC39DRAFT_382133 [Podospora conica]|nr:hypothetical protein QBC39DRAFT_382133 [Schizothecium conicum]